MKNPAPAESPVHELVHHRWSPRAFSDKPVSPAILEEHLRSGAMGAVEQQLAAVGLYRRHERRQRKLRQDSEHDGGVQSGLGEACAGAGDFRRTNSSNKEGKPNTHAFHDVGSASAQLSFQAVADGLYVHQMAGFDANKAREVFHIPDDWQAVAAIAIGYPGDPEFPARQAQRA